MNKKKSINDTSLDYGLQDSKPLKVSPPSPAKETVKESRRRESSENVKLHDGLIRVVACGLEAENASVLDRSSCASKKGKLSSVKKTKNKKKTESSDHTKKVLVVENHGSHDAIDIEPLTVSSPLVKETRKESESLDIEKLHELTCVVRNEESNSKEKTKKMKKKKRSSHTQKDLVFGDHELQDSTNVDLAKEKSKECKIQECSDSGNPHESTDLVENRALVVLKKMKKKKRSNLHTLPVLDVKNHELQHDATEVEHVKVSSSLTKEETKEPTEKPQKNEASISEKCIKKIKKKKKKKKKKRRPDLVVEDYELHKAENVEDAKLSSSSQVKETKRSKHKRQESKNLQKLAGVARNEEFDMEIGTGTSILEKKKKIVQNLNDIIGCSG
ncbi:unnamed protein product [Cochlearia groenlandica]